MEDNILSPQGRIRRSTFWTRWLIVFTINTVLTIMSRTSGDEPMALLLASLISLMLGVFMLLQTIKRMHDVDKSGWYSIIPIYNLVLALTDGTPGINRYGKDPKNRPTQCAACQTMNEPDNMVCKNCGTSFVFHEVKQEATSDSDTNIMVFIVVGFVTVLINFISRLMPLWYDGPLKYIHFVTTLLWAGAILYLALGLKKESNRIMGLILSSLWIIYSIVSNAMWVFNLH